MKRIFDEEKPDWEGDKCAYWIDEPEDGEWSTMIRLPAFNHLSGELFITITDQMALEDEHLAYKRCRGCGDEFPAITFIKRSAKVYYQHKAYYVFFDGPLCMQCDPPTVEFPIFKVGGKLRWRMHLIGVNGEPICVADYSTTDGHVIGHPRLNAIPMRHMDRKKDGNKFRFVRGTEKDEEPENGYVDIMNDPQPTLTGLDRAELDPENYKEKKI